MLFFKFHILNGDVCDHFLDGQNSQDETTDGGLETNITMHEDSWDIIF